LLFGSITPGIRISLSGSLYLRNAAAFVLTTRAGEFEFERAHVRLVKRRQDDLHCHVVDVRPSQFPSRHAAAHGLPGVRRRTRGANSTGRAKKIAGVAQEKPVDREHRFLRRFQPFPSCSWTKGTVGADEPALDGDFENPCLFRMGFVGSAAFRFLAVTIPTRRSSCTGPQQ